MPKPTGSGLVAPDNFSIRKPTESSQKHGRVVNPVRYYEIGGADKPSIWSKDVTPSSQSAQKNVAAVEKATSTKGAHSVADQGGA